MDTAVSDTNLKDSLAPDANVAIIGVGLIGGSLGLAIRAAVADGRLPPKLRVIGFDDADVLSRAIEIGAIDTGSRTPGDAVANADVVFLAAPIAANLRLLGDIAGALKPGAVITDVGSVKSAMERVATEVLPEGVVFVGGHPMAGSERHGIEAADAFLLENATYVLCPPEPFLHHPSAVNPLVTLLQAIGARVLLLPSRRHDEIAAAVSHVPQLVAVALARFAADRNEVDMNVHRLAAGGFRDMTRIASSPYELWREILAANNGPVLDALASLIAELQRIRNRLIEESYDELSDTFEAARAFRESVPTSSKGFLRPLADVYVAAADRPGALHSITRVLFENGLNIKDIELLKLREGTGGTFRVGFDSADDARRAAVLLTDDGHRAHTLQTDADNT